MLVCAFYHFIAHETAGAACIRLSLRPLTGEGVTSMQTSGETRREIAKLCLLVAYCSSRIACLKFESEFHSVIACDKRKAFAQGSTCDEAIQLSSSIRRKLDCFASLAMTMMGRLKFEKSVSRI
jgi:hypothetical protein